VLKDRPIKDWSPCSGGMGISSRQWPVCRTESCLMYLYVSGHDWIGDSWQQFCDIHNPVLEGNSVGLCDRTACWSEALCDGLRASGNASALLRRLYLTTVD